MLPIVLVLLVAQGAFSASIPVSVVPRSQVGPIYDNGNAINRYVTNGAFGVIDGGELSVYISNIEEVVNDLTNGGSSSQALALGQTIGTLSELVNGIPGDACEYANLIDTYAGYLSGSRNSAVLRQALNAYVSRLANSIGAISNYANNPESARFTTGSSSGCAAGGRNYNIEPVWDAILSNANAQSIGPLNEQYCVAKRLYNSFSAAHNNVGAAVTSASIPPVTQLIQQATGPLANFLRVLGQGGNASSAAASAQAALRSAVNNVVL